MLGFRKKISLIKILNDNSFFLVLIFSIILCLISPFFLLLPLVLIFFRLFFGRLRLSGSDCVLFFGLPGSGKSLHLAKLLYDNSDRVILTNDEFSHCFFSDGVFSHDDLGSSVFPGAVYVFDEISLSGFDSRTFSKNFTPEILSFFKKHRHYDCPVVMTNQGYTETDIKIRSYLCNIVYFCEPAFFGFYKATRLDKTFSLNELSGDLQEGFETPSFFARITDPSSVLYAHPKFYGKFYNTKNPDQLPLNDSHSEIEANFLLRSKSLKKH